MATGSVYTGVGGVDASLAYELGGDNIGAAFNSSLTTYAGFTTARSSMADLIALGVYTAVRSCGGPPIGIRAGRVDATGAGPPGVPLPQDSNFTFVNQFDRMGFTQVQMIQMTACGHTMGGVHAVNFPEIVLPGSAPPNDYQLFDGTANFDNNICQQYVSNNQVQDPLAVGPSVPRQMDSDFVVFGSDNPDGEPHHFHKCLPDPAPEYD
jgi:hypothetical protein